MPSDRRSLEPRDDILYAAAVQITLSIAVYIYLGAFSAILFVGLAVATFALWRHFGFGARMDRGFTVPAMLGLMALQLLAYAEMVAFDFAGQAAARFPALFNGATPFNEYAFVIAFPLTTMSVTMFAAIALLRDRPIATYVFLFNLLWALSLGVLIYGAALVDPLRMLPGFGSIWLPFGAAIFILRALKERRNEASRA